ncbi:hypothetical protein ACFVY4_26920 [Streptomyces sp. NPDC058299]|uniref:hypothetical protein n=1 Tax=Streptomyces sp. NPDC058299 TaxID=3346435 RepID=UPI0036EDC980
MNAADHTPAPTPAEVGRARAYLTAAAHGFHILLEDWTGIGNGTATTTDKQGTTLLYTGDELHPFDALVPCTRHGRHRVGVTWPAQLDKALADTAACSAQAPAPAAGPSTGTVRLAQQPSSLWLINRAVESLDEDRQKPAAS